MTALGRYRRLIGVSCIFKSCGIGGGGDAFAGVLLRAAPGIWCIADGVGAIAPQALSARLGAGTRLLLVKMGG